MTITMSACLNGKGVTGTVDGRAVALGNARLMAHHDFNMGELSGKADALRSSGATALFVAIDGKPGGVIAIADPIKATMRAALDSLRADGIHIVMLTSDNRMTADAVAGQLGIDDVEADVLPEDKNRMMGSRRGSVSVGHYAAGGMARRMRVNEVPSGR